MARRGHCRVEHGQRRASHICSVVPSGAADRTGSEVECCACLSQQLSMTEGVRALSLESYLFDEADDE
jgi:hypothetical protein